MHFLPLSLQFSPVLFCSSLYIDLYFMIMLKDALREMEKSEGFDISFYTADGKKIELTNVILSKKMPEEEKQVRPTVTGHSKAANHFENSTRNFLIKKNNQIRKAHIRLLTHFNSQPIHY